MQSCIRVFYFFKFPYSIFKVRNFEIRKTRYCFICDNLYFELDVYPFAENWAILEVELTNENDIVTIPDFIKVIKEVTNDEAYSNYALAGHLPN